MSDVEWSDEVITCHKCVQLLKIAVIRVRRSRLYCTYSQAIRLTVLLPRKAYWISTYTSGVSSNRSFPLSISRNMSALNIKKYFSARSIIHYRICWGWSFPLLDKWNKKIKRFFFTRTCWVIEFVNHIRLEVSLQSYVFIDTLESSTCTRI